MKNKKYSLFIHEGKYMIGEFVKEITADEVAGYYIHNDIKKTRVKIEKILSSISESEDYDLYNDIKKIDKHLIKIDKHLINIINETINILEEKKNKEK